MFKSSPPNLISSFRLYGIWGVSTDDVFAVGEGGTVLHYDGSTWSRMTESVTYL